MGLGILKHFNAMELVLKQDPHEENNIFVASPATERDYLPINYKDFYELSRALRSYGDSHLYLKINKKIQLSDTELSDISVEDMV